MVWIHLCSILLVCIAAIYGKEQKEISAFFYIYEWDAALGDVYPPEGQKLDPKSTYDHSFRENRGAGKMLVPEVGLFQTWQFSLYKNAMSRLEVSRYRTR